MTRKNNLATKEQTIDAYFLVPGRMGNTTLVNNTLEDLALFPTLTALCNLTHRGNMPGICEKSHKLLSGSQDQIHV